MAQIIASIIALTCLLILTLVQGEHPIVQRRSKARAFIESQCRTTLYPDLCVRCLSPYAGNLTTAPSHRQLAQIALEVSLGRAESTRAYVTGVVRQLNETKGRHYQDVTQCLDQINDGVDQLANCIKEAQKIKEDGQIGDFTWHASNVQTWMSTALTDATLCIDGFSGRGIGGKTKMIIKAKVLNLQQVTSNALALFNRFAQTYRSSHAIKPKSP